MFNRASVGYINNLCGVWSHSWQNNARVTCFLFLLVSIIFGQKTRTFTQISLKHHLIFNISLDFSMTYFVNKPQNAEKRQVLANQRLGELFNSPNNELIQIER